MVIVADHEASEENQDLPLANLIYALRKQLNSEKVCQLLVASDKYSVFTQVELICQLSNELNFRERLICAMFEAAV